jgi:hypothetical protein
MSSIEISCSDRSSSSRSNASMTARSRSSPLIFGARREREARASGFTGVGIGASPYPMSTESTLC